MLGYVDKGEVWRIPVDEMNDKYIRNPRSYYCPTYFYNDEMPYPETYFHGAGYFLPWWAVECVYQQSFQVIYFLIKKRAITDTLSFVFVFSNKWSNFYHKYM